MIAAAGVKFIRMDFTWESIERQEGQYDWSAHDELMANLERRGLRALYILDYSNALYEETVVSRNPISGKKQKGVGSPQQYASLAMATAKAIREVDPETTIIGFGVMTTPALVIDGEVKVAGKVPSVDETKGLLS